VRLDSTPALRRPVLIAAFHGWNDGGSAATLAAGFLSAALGATPFAAIEPDEYVDFQQSRPQVAMGEDGSRTISWPETTFAWASLPAGDRDVILCVGVEPNLRWKAFAAEITELAVALNVDLALTLGGLLADTAHTQPVPVSGSAADPALAAELGLRLSRYEGPTGIVGVLHDALATAGVRSASLWAAVPHYISASVNPAGALALVTRVGELLGLDLETHDLEAGVERFLAEIAEALDGDEETTAYVRELEQREGDDEPEIPSGDDIAEQLQRFLREQGDTPEG
jgi:proteasome assembly chaperone (PAC2) family protein